MQLTGSGLISQAWLSGELFLQCYAKQSPLEDVVHCTCRSAIMVGPTQSEIVTSY